MFFWCQFTSTLETNVPKKFSAKLAQNLPYTRRLGCRAVFFLKFFFPKLISFFLKLILLKEKKKKIVKKYFLTIFFFFKLISKK